MGTLYQFGPFEADVAAGRLRKGHSRIALREKSFQVLVALLEHPGEVITREDLRRRLWPDDVFVDFDNNLNTAMARLREAIGDSAEHPQFIETLPKHGYRFIARVIASNGHPPHEASAPAVDSAAYDAYAQGRSFLARGTPDYIARAKQCLEDAVARDPLFALAYDAMAELYWYVGFFGLAAPRDACATGIYYALRALELDPSLGETHALLGQYRKQLDYNWAEVDRELVRARELKPESPLVRLRYAVNGLMPHGRTNEAVAELERAVEKEPASLLMRGWFGVMLHLDRQYDRAIETARRAIQLDPTSFWGHFILACAYREQQRVDLSIASFRRAAELGHNSPSLVGWLGLVLARAGHTDEARALLAQLKPIPPSTYVPPTSHAWIFIGLREMDQAFEWLDRAVDVRDHMMMAIKSYPFFDPYREDPRYLALLQRMNLKAQ